MPKYTVLQQTYIYVEATDMIDAVKQAQEALPEGMTAQNVQVVPGTQDYGPNE